MDDCAALASELEACHRRLLAEVEHVPVETLESEPAVGDWPVRTVWAHLAVWIDEILLAADGALTGQAPSHHPITDEEAFNVKSGRAAEGLPWDQAQALLDGKVQEAVAFMRAFPSAEMGLPVTLPWGGEGSMSQLLTGILEHHEEHAADLARWRQPGDS